MYIYIYRSWYDDQSATPPSRDKGLIELYQARTVVTALHRLQAAAATNRKHAYTYLCMYIRVYVGTDTWL